MKKHFTLSSLIILIASVALTPVAISVNEQKPLEIVQIEPTLSSANNITLLNPGREPRQELRFTPTPASEQTSTISTTMDLNLLVDGQAMPKMNSPTTETKMAVEVTQVQPGEIYVNFIYTDAQVLANSDSNPALVEIMNSQLNELVNLQGEYIIDEHGNTKEIDFQLPLNTQVENKQLLEQTIQSVTQLSSIFPTEAVGIGAEWLVSQPLTINGINLNQRTTYKLVNLENNLATLEVTLSQTAEQQTLEPLPQAPNTNLELLSLQGDGKGTLTIKLDYIMPITGTIELVSNTKMTMTADNSNQQQLLESQSSMKINIKSESMIE